MKKIALSPAGSLFFAVGILSLVVHLRYLSEGGKDPSFHTPLVDAKEYDVAARAMASGQGLGDQPFFQPPLFPALLAALYAMAGPRVAAAKFFLGCLGAFTAVLAAALACRLFGRRAGWLAGVITALYGPLVFYDTQLLPAGLATLLGTGFLLLALRASDSPRLAGWMAAGVVAGLACLAVPNFLVVALAVAAWAAFALRRDFGGKGAAGRALILLACVSAVIAPVTIRNRIVSGQTVLISTNGGINLFIGNNPRSWETMAIRPGLDWDYLERSAIRSGARTASQADRFFQKQVLRYAAEQPADFSRVLATKLLLLVNARELPRTFDIYVFRDFSRLLHLLVGRAGPVGWPWGLLFPLAVLGMATGCRASARASLPLVYLIAFGFSVALFFVSARHRLPMAPVLAVFAAQGVGGLIERGGSRRGRLAALAVLGSAAVLANLPVRAPTDGFDFKAELYTLLGIRAGDGGDAAAALRLYEKALSVNPDFADAHNQIGNARAARGEPAAALTAYAEAIRIRPDFAEAHSNIGTALQRLDRHAEALAHFEDALRLRPHLAKTSMNAALSCLALGRGRDAVGHLERAVSSDPTLLDAANMLAWVLATHPDAAVRDGRKAAAYGEALCRGTGFANPPYLDTLAAAYAEAGRFEDAVATARKALDLGVRTRNVPWTGEVRNRLELYVKRQPYRDASLGGAPRS
jgi:tetratricopeptide (TPR) repeat protein